MDIALSITLDFFKVLVFTAGIGMMIALCFSLILMWELNKILSATEEYEASENIDRSTFRQMPFSSATHAENTWHTTSSLPSS
jgi:predicted cobalt transporter CbtA